MLETFFPLPALTPPAWLQALDPTKDSEHPYTPRAFFGRQMRTLFPITSASVALTGWGSSSIGTISTPTLASTNLHTSRSRSKVTSGASGASASSLVLGVNGGVGCVYRGDAAGRGGFLMHFVFAMGTDATAVANQRVFMGLHDGSAALAGTQDTNTLTNCIGVGWRSADSNLQVMHNDASGNVTAINLGSSFPANNTTAVYDVHFYALPNSSTVYYVVGRLDTGDRAAGLLTTNLPSSTTFLAAHLHANNGGTAAAVELDIMRAVLEG